MYCEAFNSWILQLEFTKHLTTTGGFHLSIMFRNSARLVIKFKIKKSETKWQKEQFLKMMVINLPLLLT